MMQLSRKDIESLVEIVGREGAFAALEKSKKLKTNDLAAFAQELGLHSGKRDTKKSLSERIVRHVDRRINKSLDELKKMSQDELIKYFDEVKCDEDELIEVLKSIDLKSRAKSRRELLEFAANQITSLGIFERLSDRDNHSLRPK